MICQRCLLRAARREASSAGTRAISVTPLRSSTALPTESITAVPRQGEAGGRNPSAATSTSAAQPFSTPLTSSPAEAGIKRRPAKSSSPAVRSSVVAGTPLKGLNFLKNSQDPVALPDEEYPPWLWTILETKKGKAEEATSDPDLFSKSRATRKAAQRRAKKRSSTKDSTGPADVPIQEQTIDLPTGDGTAAGALRAAEVRDTLTKAMRQKRRAAIKETNFLKTMA